MSIDLLRTNAWLLLDNPPMLKEATRGARGRRGKPRKLLRKLLSSSRPGGAAIRCDDPALEASVVTFIVRFLTKERIELKARGGAATASYPGLTIAQ